MEEELIRIGMISYMDNNYQSAISDFSKALEKNPNNINASIYRGCTYNRLGDYNSAINDFNNAEKHIENNENIYELYYNRAKAHYFNMNFKQAESDLEKIKKLDNITDEQKERIANLCSKINLN